MTGASDAYDDLVHQSVSEVLSLCRQRDVRIGGSFHLEHDRRPTSQGHTDVHELVAGNVERSSLIEEQQMTAIKR